MSKLKLIVTDGTGLAVMMVFDDGMFLNIHLGREAYCMQPSGIVDKAEMLNPQVWIDRWGFVYEIS